MFDALLDLFLTRKNGNAPLDNKISFDLKVTFIDERRKEVNCSFDSPEEREAFIEGYLAKPGKSKPIDKVCFQDTLIFWRRNSGEDALPTKPPKLPGHGELVLRIRGGNGTVIETVNLYNIPEIIDAIGSSNKKFCVAQEIAALRRRIIYERRSVLVKTSEIPASAELVESAD